MNRPILNMDFSGVEVRILASPERIKRRAKELKKARGCRHHEALNAAAQEVGMNSYAAYLEFWRSNELQRIVWELRVRKHYPIVKFTTEDGSGNTYLEKGSVMAHVGPDMQADVVGVFVPNEFWNVWSPDGLVTERITKEKAHA